MAAGTEVGRGAVFGGGVFDRGIDRLRNAAVTSVAKQSATPMTMGLVNFISDAGLTVPRRASMRVIYEAAQWSRSRGVADQEFIEGADDLGADALC